MTDDKLLDFASKRAALLNLSSAWGTDEDGVLLIQLITRIEQLTAEVERLNEALRKCVMEAADWARQAGEAKGKLEGSEMPGIVDSWKAECERLREALEIAQDYKDCGCSYDNPNDICLGHLKLFERLNARAALEAKS